jgi:hypothetical protein
VGSNPAGGMDVCVVLCCCIRTVVWNMKDRRIYKVQNGSKEKTGQKKESRWGHVRLSFVSVVCCQVEVSATGWALVQTSPMCLKCNYETSKNVEA